MGHTGRSRLDDGDQRSDRQRRLENSKPVPIAAMSAWRSDEKQAVSHMRNSCQPEFH